MRKNNPKLKTAAQSLRRNMTKEERRLWYDALRGYKPRFTRQHPLGNYIVDFYCAAAHLAVELDGGQHYEAESTAKDDERTRQLGRLGIAVIRFPNNAVNQNFQAVCDAVDRCVKARIAGEPLPDISAELII
ncbi:MAG: DUF559 domain-containing protein [Clostridia bacterium]|nr:DUF559 domain-containing protein [Oscillospiraceae bacterium]MBQ3763307.1 DUF559 domain-containing protein [Clostridia bacterium]